VYITTDHYGTLSDTCRSINYLLISEEEEMSRVKRVYELSKELAHDPEQIADAQALTLDQSRPQIGLKGSLGLFGSSEWWGNIEAGVIPLKRLSGVIRRVYVAGQDRSDVPNAFDFASSNGTVRMEGIYVNSPEDVAVYQVGRQVDVVYVLDELKVPSSGGGKNYLEIVLEVSISLQ
jgi:hypothetical protein